MCYSLSYYRDGKYHYTGSTVWGEMLSAYDKLYGEKGIEELKIRDDEYMVDFIDYKWERDEGLIGWCGNR